MGHDESRRPGIPGRPPGEYEVGLEDVQEFVAGALYCQRAMSLERHTPAGPAAAGIVVEVPVGQQPAFDRILATHEHEAVELDITSKWVVMHVPPSTALEPSVGIARLDLLLAGPTLPTPVLTQILFGEFRVRGQLLWAAALARRILLLREPTFHRIVLQEKDTPAIGSEDEAVRSGGLEIEDPGGCDMLRVELEKAGVKDVYEGRRV